MTALRREGLIYAALAALAIAASCAKAENSPLADQGGDGEAGEDGRGGTAGAGASGGSAGAAATGGTTSGGGSAGKGGTSTGGSAGKGGTTSSGGTEQGGASGAPSTTYGCLDDGMGGEGGQGGASGGAPGEAGAGGAGPSTLFFDDFEDGDADGWTHSNGVWGIAVDGGSNVYEQTEIVNNTLRVANVANACWADQVVEARVNVLSFGGGNSTSYSTSIFARYLDSETYYSLGVNSGNNGELFIGKRVAGGEFDRLATDSDGKYRQDHVWFTLRLEVVGTTLRGYYDGTLVLEATDSQITSGGVAVGTNHASARFDDVKVTVP